MAHNKFEFCKTIFETLLNAQVAVRKNGPDPKIKLIHDDEIHEIQRIWRTEHGDWKNTAYAIHEKIMGQSIEPKEEDLGAFGLLEQSELETSCNEHGVPYELLARSLQVEFDMQGITRRQKVHTSLTKILSEEWRDNMSDAVKDVADRKRKIKEIYE